MDLICIVEVDWWGFRLDPGPLAGRRRTARADVRVAGLSGVKIRGCLKRPLIKEDLKVIQYQSQEADTLLLHQMVHHRTTLRRSRQ